VDFFIYLDRKYKHIEKKPPREIQSPLMPRSNFPFVGREQAFQSLFTSFCSRYELVGNKHPICSVFASPGQGKSRFCTEVLRLSNNKPAIDIAFESFDNNNKYKNSLKNFFQECIPIGVTFNHESTPIINEKNSEYDLDPSVGLNLRILWIYLFGENSYKWTTFYLEMKDVYLHFFKPEDSYVILEIIKWIREDSQRRLKIDNLPPVLLVLDEIIRGSGIQGKINENRLWRMINLFSHVMEELSASEYQVLFTTLNATSIEKMQYTPSQRPIYWLDLGLLSFGESVSFLRNESYFKMMIMEQPQVFSFCLSECNGHPRSIEFLSKKFASPSRSTSKAILDSVVNDLDMRYKRWGHSCFVGGDDAHESALTLALQMCPEFSKAEKFMAYGSLMTPLLHTGEQFCPIMTPIFMRLEVKDPKEPLKQLVSRILEIEESVNQLSFFSGKKFEFFHDNVEMIVRLVQYPRTSPISLRDYYCRSPNSHAIIPLKPNNLCSTITFLFPPKFDIYNSIPNIPSDEMVEKFKQYPNHIFVPSDETNVAVDSAYFEQDIKGNLWVISTQKKYTKPGATTYFTDKELVECYNDMKILWSKHVDKLGIDIDHVFFVFVCWREVSKDTQWKASNMPNCLLLTKESLKYFYSPTLAMRPQFFSDSTHSEIILREQDRIHSSTLPLQPLNPSHLSPQTQSSLLPKLLPPPALLFGQCITCIGKMRCLKAKELPNMVTDYGGTFISNTDPEVSDKVTFIVGSLKSLDEKKHSIFNKLQNVERNIGMVTGARFMDCIFTKKSPLPIPQTKLELFDVEHVEHVVDKKRKRR
jgi:hypothetical protein